MAESTKQTGVEVPLSGCDGKAYATLSACQSAARRAGVDASVIKEFVAEAMSGDYAHLLQTVMTYFEVQQK